MGVFFKGLWEDGKVKAAFYGLLGAVAMYCAAHFGFVLPHAPADPAPVVAPAN